MKKRIVFLLVILFCCICLPAFAAIPSFLNAFPKNTLIAVHQPLFKADHVPLPTVEVEVDEVSGLRTYTISGLKAWGVPKKALREYKGGVGGALLDDQVRLSMTAAEYKRLGFSWTHVFGGIEKTGVYEADSGAYVLMMQNKTGTIRIYLDGSQVQRAYSVKATNHYLTYDGEGYLINASTVAEQKKQTLSLNLERVHPRTHVLVIDRLKVIPAKKGQPEAIWEDGRWTDETGAPIAAPDGVDPAKLFSELTKLTQEPLADAQPGAIDLSQSISGLHDRWPLVAPLPAKPEMAVAALPDGRISRTFTGLEPWGLGADAWGVWEYRAEDGSWQRTQLAAQEPLTLISPDNGYYTIGFSASDSAHALSLNFYEMQFEISAGAGSLRVARNFDGFSEMCYSLPGDIYVEAAYGDGMLIDYLYERRGEEDCICSARFKYDITAKNFIATDIRLYTEDEEYRWVLHSGWTDSNRKSVPQPQAFDPRWFIPPALTP